MQRLVTDLVDGKHLCFVLGSDIVLMREDGRRKEGREGSPKTILAMQAMAAVLVCAPACTVVFEASVVEVVKGSPAIRKAFEPLRARVVEHSSNRGPAQAEKAAAAADTVVFVGAVISAANAAGDALSAAATHGLDAVQLGSSLAGSGAHAVSAVSSPPGEDASGKKAVRLRRLAKKLPRTSLIEGNPLQLLPLLAWSHARCDFVQRQLVQLSWSGGIALPHDGNASLFQTFSAKDGGLEWRRAFSEADADGWRLEQLLDAPSSPVAAGGVRRRGGAAKAEELEAGGAGPEAAFPAAPPAEKQGRGARSQKKQQALSSRKQPSFLLDFSLPRVSMMIGRDGTVGTPSSTPTKTRQRQQHQQDYSDDSEAAPLRKRRRPARSGGDATGAAGATKRRRRKKPQKAADYYDSDAVEEEEPPDEAPGLDDGMEEDDGVDELAHSGAAMLSMLFRGSLSQQSDFTVDNGTSLLSAGSPRRGGSAGSGGNNGDGGGDGGGEGSGRSSDAEGVEGPDQQEVESGTSTPVDPEGMAANAAASLLLGIASPRKSKPELQESDMG